MNDSVECAVRNANKRSTVYYTKRPALAIAIQTEQTIFIKIDFTALGWCCETKRVSENIRLNGKKDYEK